MARNTDQGRGTTRMDRKTEQAVNAQEGDTEAAREAAAEADRDVQSGGKSSTGNVGRRTEGTDHGASRKH